jgi:hypothetical protein
VRTDASVDKIAKNLFSYSDVKTEKFYHPFSVSVPRVPYFESQDQCVEAGLISFLYAASSLVKSVWVYSVQAIFPFCLLDSFIGSSSVSLIL